MYDSNKYIKEFHDKQVSLTEAQRSLMRNRRNSNEKRVVKGLENNEKPKHEEFVAQGSYAMHTMVQSIENDYDIDDGIIFDKEELIGYKGAEISALETRKMICDAVDDNSFKKDPKVLKNCVRIFYNDGTHVDMPAYRRLADGTLELASSDWKGSSPSEVTTWFNEAVIDKSPDVKNGRQMRRITKLLKAFMKSRLSWGDLMISGFALSVLVNESYSSNTDSDCISLYNTMVDINNRLNLNKIIYHPSRISETLTKTSHDASVVFFNKKLKKAIDDLVVLLESDCNEKKSLKAWQKVFNHDYFTDQVEKLNEDEKLLVAESLKGGNDNLTIAKGLSGIGAISTASKSGAVKTGNAYGSIIKNR